MRWAPRRCSWEIRAHLGFETQRQWADRAMGRTMPCLFGIFSLVVLMAKTLHPEQLPVRQTVWYPKPEATFSKGLLTNAAKLLARRRDDVLSGGSEDLPPSG